MPVFGQGSIPAAFTAGPGPEDGDTVGQKIAWRDFVNDRPAYWRSVRSKCVYQSRREAGVCAIDDEMRIRRDRQDGDQQTDAQSYP